MSFAQEGGEGATPYEVLLAAALVGDSSHFTRQDSVEECWRVVAAAAGAPAAGRSSTPQGSWGPAEADQLADGLGGWHSPWLARRADLRGPALAPAALRGATGYSRRRRGRRRGDPAPARAASSCACSPALRATR